jgi:hypothetical protein
MYFRGDEAFYAEIGTALAKSRRRYRRRTRIIAFGLKVRSLAERAFGAEAVAPR